ncbi:MAG: serine/threonine-protein phosphatase [Sandaracinaceae bacterium]|jgi:serine/threonine protein phosphatase PrpC|nr:serine/threonine-protein phosphatase [Sandaracinaceae bacterium]
MSTEDGDKNSPAANDDEGATMMWDGLKRDASAEVTSGIQIRIYGQTDVGLVREHNEDNFLIADISAGVKGGVKGLDDKLLNHTLGKRGTIFTVCDGMGGAAAGEVASQMAVDTVFEIMSAGGAPKDRDDFARRLVKSIEEAGARIFASAKIDRTRRGMGTTSTVAGLMDKMLFVGQIGDSRAYVLRGSDFNQVTKDQSLVNQLIEAGQLTEEEAESFEHQNIILQALGTADSVQVDLTFLELRRGDRVMVCSDGLSGLVHPLMIKDVMAAVKDQRACCATLIEMARTGGGHDNITVIVADFDGSDLPDAKESPQKVAYQQYPLPHVEEGRRSMSPDGARPSQLPRPPDDGTLKRADSIYDTVGSRRPRTRAPLLAGILLLLIGIGGAFLAWKKGVFGGVAEEPHDAPQNDPHATAPALVPVLVHSDVNGGELFIDNESRGALSPGAATTVRLAPGDYRFEVRSSGAAIANEVVTVRAGEASAEVTLNMPPGAAEAGDAAVVGVEFGEAAVETDTPPPAPPSARRALPAPSKRPPESRSAPASHTENPSTTP